MTNRSLPAPLRRLLVALVTLLCLAAPAAAAQALTPETSAAGAGGAAAYDDSLRRGRLHPARSGVRQADAAVRARTCFEGAVPWRKTFGAEACTLQGRAQGYGFVSTVDVRQCRALHRRWISQVNYCASEPDRSPGAVFNAPQCTGAATVYVNLQETEGYYDECLTTTRAVELVQRSARRRLDAGGRGLAAVEHPVPVPPRARVRGRRVRGRPELPAVRRRRGDDR